MNEGGALPKLFGIELKQHKKAQIDPTAVEDELQVIGCGLCRTGTTSLKAAFEILGFDPCHHMSEVVETRSRMLAFTNLLQRKWSPDKTEEGKAADMKVLKGLMRGYKATVDVPCVDLYEELIEIYPSAKVVLSVRDSDEAWWRSMAVLRIPTTDLHYYLTLPVRLFREHRILHNMTIVDNYMRSYGCVSKEVHTLHNKRVQEVVCADNLLVFNVKEGWGPLCKFLDVPIPDQPFPNLNDAKTLTAVVYTIQVYCFFVWLFYIALLAGLIYLPFGLFQYYKV